MRGDGFITIPRKSGGQSSVIIDDYEQSSVVIDDYKLFPLFIFFLTSFN